ncbi:hypothetical protein FHT00_002849 [Sphingomonas insulae]|uniref:DNA gyrase inhibitor YacG n=1 Tax=Sphingomonas insulae TaxID=424800 RepID=UPI0013CF7A81|nr:DNA gyrase inhibitor YacG [Sphingomonas insulae]NIJ30876.1 hypothetical protein [Sphingomonas insulae]
MNTSNCPVCRKPATPDDAPFCSRGCRDRDLLQWLNEGYRIPVKDDEQVGLDSIDRAD